MTFCLHAFDDAGEHRASDVDGKMLGRVFKQGASAGFYEAELIGVKVLAQSLHHLLHSLAAGGDVELYLLIVARFSRHDRREAADAGIDPNLSHVSKAPDPKIRSARGS